MRQYHASLSQPAALSAAKSWEDCTTNMLGFDDRVKLSDAAIAKNADIPLRGKIGEVVEVREDGRVSIRFEGGRLSIGQSPETFQRIVELGLKAKGR